MKWYILKYSRFPLKRPNATCAFPSPCIRVLWKKSDRKNHLKKKHSRDWPKKKSTSATIFSELSLLGLPRIHWVCASSGLLILKKKHVPGKEIGIFFFEEAHAPLQTLFIVKTILWLRLRFLMCHKKVQRKIWKRMHVVIETKYILVLLFSVWYYEGPLRNRT